MTSSNKGNPFAALAGLRAALPVGAAQAEPAAPAAAKVPGPADRFEPKLVLSTSRKGRGGKTVTMVGGIKPHAREEVCRELKRALGCGAVVEDTHVVVLGDVGPRVRSWLEQHGARKIVGS